MKWQFALKFISYVLAGFIESADSRSLWEPCGLIRRQLQTVCCVPLAFTQGAGWNCYSEHPMHAAFQAGSPGYLQSVSPKAQNAHYLSKPNRSWWNLTKPRTHLAVAWLRTSLQKSLTTPDLGTFVNWTSHTPVLEQWICLQWSSSSTLEGRCPPPLSLGIIPCATLALHGAVGVICIWEMVDANSG